MCCLCTIVRLCVSGMVLLRGSRLIYESEGLVPAFRPIYDVTAGRVASWRLRVWLLSWTPAYDCRSDAELALHLPTRRSYFMVFCM